MNDRDAKCFLCLTALCLSPTNRDANLLRALGTLLKISDGAQAGALTLISNNTTIATNNNKSDNNDNNNNNSNDKSNSCSMLERAEYLAADLRAQMSPQAAIEGFCVLLLLFVQGPPPGAGTSSTAAAADTDNENSSNETDTIATNGSGGGSARNITAGSGSGSSAPKRAPRQRFRAAMAAANIHRAPPKITVDLSMIKFDARTSVLLRRLAYLLRIKLSTVNALEELAIFNLEQANKRMLLEQQKNQKNNSPEKKWIRGLKIGAAATAAGGLLAVTGGLAAPALATGLASLGLGAVATVTTTATVATLLGAGGAGLGAYKMNRRTRGVKYFEFQAISNETATTTTTTATTENSESENTEKENLMGMTVYICISGYLRAPGPEISVPENNIGPETAKALNDQKKHRLRRGSSSNRSASEMLQQRRESTSLLHRSSSDMSSSQRSIGGASSNVHVKKSAFHSPDFYAPWGAQPKYMFPEQILDRFYSVVAPEKRFLAPLLLQTFAGQEDALMDELARIYRFKGENNKHGVVLHPKHLCPPEAQRDYFQGPEQQIYHQLLQRAGARVTQILNSNQSGKPVATSTAVVTTPPDWQPSESTIKTLMDTERAWDSFRESINHNNTSNVENATDDNTDGTNEEETFMSPEKTKEEIDGIIADLMQKFEEDDDYVEDEQQTEETNEHLIALEEEIKKMRIQPTAVAKADKIKSVDAKYGHEVYWWRDKVARYGDHYTLVWEPRVLLQVGECVQNLIKEGAAKGALQSLQFTAFSAVMAAVALPVMITQYVANLDDFWALAVERADEAGQLLADALMSDDHGNRPVVLIGYSMGGRVVASCLSALAKIASGGQDGDDIIQVEDYDPNSSSDNNNNNNNKIQARNQNERKKRLRAATIVRDAVIIGAPLDININKWTQWRSVVVGRFINVYNPNDWVLALLYRYKSWSLHIAGLQKAECKPSPLFSPIENYNVSKIVNGHGEYHSKMQQVLAHIGIGDVDNDSFHGDYFVTVPQPSKKKKK